MNGIRVYSFLLLIIVGGLVDNIAFSQLPDEHNALKKKLQGKWLEYLHSLGTVEGSIHYLWKINGKIHSDLRNEHVCLYPLESDSRGPEGGHTSRSVIGRDYRFSLERTDADALWSIKDLRFEGAHKKLDEWNFPVFLESSWNDDPVGYNIFNTLGVGLFGLDSNENLPYFFSSEWMKINEIKEIETEGDKRLHLSFALTMPDFPDSIKSLPHFAQESPKWKHYSLQGDVVLSTDYYLVSEAIFHREFLFSTEDVTLNIDYDTKVYRTPLPKNYHKKSTIRENVDRKEEKTIVEVVQQFDLRETNPKNNKRFTLSNFGLPEPDFGDRRPNRIRYIMMVFGGLLIAIAVWQMSRKRKENAA